MRGRDGARAGGVGLVEIDPTGHRLQYLAHLVAGSPLDAYVLTTEAAARSEEFAEHAGTLTDRLLVLPPADDHAAVLAHAVDAALAAGLATLVITEGDHYLRPLVSLLARHPRLPLDIRLLLMRTAEVGGPEPLRPAMLVKPGLVQILRRFPQVTIFFLTDAFGVVDSRRGYPGVRAVPDPVVVSGGVPGLRPDWFPAPTGSGMLVGLFGVISARKNLPLLVRAVSLCPEAQLVVGGRLEPEVAEFVASRPVRKLVEAGRVTVVDRLLPGDEFAAALVAVDAVAVLHDNDAPSGILAEACLRATPAIVPVGGWLDRVVTETGAGVATILDPAAVAETIRGLPGEAVARDSAAERARTRLGIEPFQDLLVGAGSALLGRPRG